MKDSAIRYLIDAGPLVGALSTRDQWHKWSAQIIATLDERVFTTEIVFGEACHLLNHERRGLLALVQQVAERRLMLSSVWDRSARRVASLMEQYPQMDAGDASLVVLSEQFPRAKIITVDVRDFTVYRRFGDEPLPLIHP